MSYLPRHFRSRRRYTVSVNLNVLGDVPVRHLPTLYRVDRISFRDGSASPATATVAVFTGAGGTGTAIVTATTPSLTTSASIQNATLADTDRRTETVLYVRVGGTAEAKTLKVDIDITDLG